MDGDMRSTSAGAARLIANVSQSEKASLVLCYIGHLDAEASGTIR